MATYRVASRGVEVISSIDIDGLVKRVGTDITRDLSDLLRRVDRIAQAEFKTRCDYTFATRDPSRRRWPERFRDTLKVEVQRPVSRGPNANPEFRIVAWSTHPVANILEEGRDQDSYEIAPTKSHGLLVWPLDNVSKVDWRSARVHKGAVTWYGDGEVMDGYSVIADSIEFAAAKALSIPVNAGDQRSGRSGNKRRAPTKRSPMQRRRA